MKIHLYMSLTGPSLISCKEIAAFLLTCLFKQVITQWRIDDILIILAQNIMKI
jgi:hypothetical protein